MSTIGPDTPATPPESRAPIPDAPPPPAPVNAQDRRPNGVGLAALIVGIVSLVLACIPFVSFIAWLPALAAVVLGIIGLVLQGRRRGFALAGLILGAVAVIVAVVVSVVTIVGIVGRVSDVARSAIAEADPSASSTWAAGSHTVTYRATGSGTASVVILQTVGSSIVAQRPGSVTLPYSKTVTVTAASADTEARFLFTVTSSDSASDLGCSIDIDGTPVATRVSASGEGVVVCVANIR